MTVYEAGVILPDSVSMGVTVGPIFVTCWFGVPIFAFKEANASFKHLVVGDVEDGCSGAGVITSISMINRSFHLVN